MKFLGRLSKVLGRTGQTDTDVTECITTATLARVIITRSSATAEIVRDANETAIQGHMLFCQSTQTSY